MERLNGELRRFLYGIAPHAEEAGYLPERYKGLPYEDASKGLQMFDALERKGMVHGSEQTRATRYGAGPSAVRTRSGLLVSYGGDTTPELRFPEVFWVTYDGENHRKESRKQAASWLFGILLTAVLAGLFAAVFAVVIR
ncbi:MAG: hypothetical protein LBL86_07295 [Coriobacteriales bacterium]|jgi:hypothetical protein|nr:hypothetical protein [Coriobacteriales bacterium]